MQLIQQISKIVKRAVSLAFGLATVWATQHIVQADDQVPFRAAYDLQLEMTVELPLAHIASTGHVQATHLGNSTAHSVTETVNLVTGEGVATHKFVAANADIITVAFHFFAVPTSDTLYVVTGTWQISGGTGRFNGASGSGNYEGQVEFTSPLTANAHFVMEGSISSPGSLK